MTKFPFFVKTIHNIKRPVVPPPLPASPYEKVIDYENLKEGYDGEGYLKSYGEREPDESDRDAFTDSYGRLHMQPVLISYNKDYSDRIISPERGFRVIGRVL